MLKSLWGPLAEYAEFASSSPVLCAKRPFLTMREPGLSNISGCCRTESNRRKELLFKTFFSLFGCMNRVLFPSSLAVDSQRSSSHKVQRVTINFLSINFSFMEVLFIFFLFFGDRLCRTERTDRQFTVNMFLMYE